MKLGEITWLILKAVVIIVGVLGFGTILGLAISGLLPIHPNTAAKVGFAIFGVGLVVVFFVTEWGTVVHKTIRHFRGN